MQIILGEGKFSANSKKVDKAKKNKRKEEIFINLQRLNKNKVCI